MKVKTKTKEKDWLDTLENIENIVSKSYIEELAGKTFESVKEKVTEKSVISWSGGKDSIVLEHILRPLHIKSIMVYNFLEYPAFMSWVFENAPERLTLINSGQDLKWLSEHQSMIFPSNNKIAGKWYDVVQHSVQNRFIKENDVDYLILGRRRSDGNYCGHNGQYAKGDCIIYSPLYLWRHEDILAYLHYNNLDIPPIYNFSDGYRQGTHNWASFILYDGMTRDQALERLWNIDRSIIIKASEYIPFIKEWYYANRKN